MSYKLFLDDQRDPYKTKHVTLPLGPWVIVKNYNEFVSTIETRGLPEFIAFDHDLSHEHYPLFENSPGMVIPYSTYKEKTGYHAAEFLIEYCVKNDLDLPKYMVHSMNITGRANIKRILRKHADRRRTAREKQKTGTDNTREISMRGAVLLHP